MFAVIWKVFKDECRAKKIDPEDVLREWQENARILETNRGKAVSWGDEAQFQDAERRALANLQKAQEQEG